MKTISSIKEMQETALQARRKGKRIGFVPTMGFLHEGHLSLIRNARKSCDLLVVSIFVNPIQFGDSEDLSEYPRDFSRDEELCKKENVDIVFYPSNDEMYRTMHSVYVQEEKLSIELCGALRPGHFRGVATVVAKLLNIVQPHTTVFGQKDAQQARIIEKMVQDLNFPVNIIIAPIVREPDGLAMSSRNTYLSSDERKRAVCLHESLCAAEKMCQQGEKDTTAIKHQMREIILKTSNATPNIPVEIDYVETADYETLQPVNEIKSKTLIAVAVKIGKTRLIDNVIIE
ncbi:pantoate--beta-alanine ligase [Verrucomicrobiota bacterium]